MLTTVRDSRRKDEFVTEMNAVILVHWTGSTNPTNRTRSIDFLGEAQYDYCYGEIELIRVFKNRITGQASKPFQQMQYFVLAAL